MEIDDYASLVSQEGLEETVHLQMADGGQMTVVPDSQSSSRDSSRD